MRRFQITRHHDPLGISGTGVVAEGVEFGDGSCYLQWISGRVRSVVRYENVGDLLEIVCNPKQHSELRFLDSVGL